MRRRADFYAIGERVGPSDTLLVVEVADRSIRYDREVELLLYARAGIGEAWIVDLNARVVEVHRKPVGDGYGGMTTRRAGDAVALALAPEIVVRLDLMFG